MLNCKTTHPVSKLMDRSMKYSVCTKYSCFLSDAMCFEEKSSPSHRDSSRVACRTLFALDLNPNLAEHESRVQMSALPHL